MRVALKKMLVFSVNASSFSGSVERSVVMAPAAGRQQRSSTGLRSVRAVDPSPLCGLVR
jgi:hypothetical protein